MNLSRRDFLKLSAVFPPALEVLSLELALGIVPSSERLITSIDDVEKDVDFKFSRVPNSRIIRFAVDLMEAVNSFVIPAELIDQPFFKQGEAFRDHVQTSLVQKKEHANVLATKPWKGALALFQEQFNNPDLEDDDGNHEPFQCVAAEIALAATSEVYFGGPLAMGNAKDAATAAAHLLDLRHGQTTKFGGRAVRFKNDFPDVVDFQMGDAFFAQYDTGTGTNAGHTGVILAKSTTNIFSNPCVLVMHSNRIVESGKAVTDGRVRIEWMDDTRFISQFIGDGIGFTRVAALRRNQIFDAVLESEKLLKEKTEEHSRHLLSQDFSEYYPGMVARFMAADVATLNNAPMSFDQRSSSLAQLYHKFLKPSEAQTWLDQKSFWDSQVFGLSEIEFFNYIYPNGKYVRYDDINIKASEWQEFIKLCTSKQLSIGDIIAHPGKAPRVDGVIWTKPEKVQELSVKDLIFIREIGSMGKTQVGIVIKTDRELIPENPSQFPKTSSAKIMFFNWNGTGMPMSFEITDFTQLDKFFNVTGIDFGVLRSEKTSHMVHVESLRNANILHYSMLPDVIRNGKPHEYPDFSSVPEFEAIRDELKHAHSFKEVGDILLKHAGLMGVQTKDHREVDPELTRYQFSVHRPESLCNLYSVKFLHALGLEKDITHWVYGDLRPAPSEDRNARELTAAEMNYWLTSEHGRRHGWTPITYEPLELRNARLKRGEIIYYAKLVDPQEEGDTGIIFGVAGELGEVIPVISKATYNHMASYPYQPWFWDNPPSFFEYSDKAREAGLHILFAHPIPGVELISQHTPRPGAKHVLRYKDTRK